MHTDKQALEPAIADRLYRMPPKLSLFCHALSQI